MFETSCAGTMSPKVSQLLHVNHATIPQVRSWQYRLNEAISCLRSDGFTVCAMDEAIFIHDSMRGRKYWSPIGTRVIAPYIGNHKRIICMAPSQMMVDRCLGPMKNSTVMRFMIMSSGCIESGARLPYCATGHHRTRHKRSRDCCAAIRVFESSICHVVLHILMLQRLAGMLVNVSCWYLNIIQRLLPCTTQFQNITPM